MTSKQKFLTLTLIFIFTLSPMSKVMSQWVKTNAPFGSQGTNFAVIDTILFLGGGGQIDCTTDYGDHWTILKDTLISNVITALEGSGTNLFASVSQGVILSQNNGKNWEEVNNGLTDRDINIIKVIDTEIFVGTNVGAFSTADNGANWFPKSIGIEYNRVLCFAKQEKHYFAGVYDGGIFRSSNFGINWDFIGLAHASIVSLAVDDINLFAGTNEGAFVSTDNGKNWERTNDGLTNPMIYDFAINGADLFAATVDGVFHLNKNRKWVSVNDGMPNLEAFSLVICGKYLFVGNMYGQVYRRLLSEMISTNSVEDQRSPNKLIESHPNPFTQSTSIKFSSSDHSLTQVSIHSLLGSEVARLFSGTLDAGEHSFTWDAHGMPAGMYVCIVKSGGEVKEIPLVLVK